MKKPKAPSSHIPYKSDDVTKWKKQYGLKLLEKGFSVLEVCRQLDCSDSMWYQWKQRDKIFAESVRKVEAIVKKNTQKVGTDLIWYLEKMKPYLQRHLTEKEACAESGINYETWKEVKSRMRKSESDIAKWFLSEIENAKTKIFALAKNTLTDGIKVNPKLAFDFLKSTQPDIYSDGRREITGANGESIVHAFPMSPEGYEEFLKKASEKKEKEDE